MQSNKNHYRSENIIIKTHENSFFPVSGFPFRFVAKLNHNFYKVMVFLKTKVWYVGFPQKVLRIPDYKKYIDKPHHKLLHRF